MKQMIFSILLVLGLATVLVSCSEPTQESNPPEANHSPQSIGQNTPQPDSGYVFTAPSGCAIAINDNMEQVLQKLGDPQSYFEAASCAFEGLDKTYTYSGFTITTRPEEADLVTSILLTDDSTATPEGIYIGSTVEDVTAAYGTPGSRTDTLLSYTKNGTTLNFILSDSSVISIEYLQA